MRKLYLLMMGMAAIALGNAPAAQAQEPSLDFGLAPADQSVAASTDAAAVEDSPKQIGPLQIPHPATDPPIQPESLRKPELPPPPPVTEAIAPAPPETLEAAAPAPTEEPKVATVAVTPTSSPQATPAPELAFDPPAVAIPASVAVEPAPPENKPDNPHLDALFQGGSDSLVARVVGSAEGTRTVEGLRTSAYYGHKDPGNGVWNLGSFSYQHGAASPEEADERQLLRLRAQAEVLQQKAIAKGIKLTLEETLNGIDLANQAPKAALDRGGYIDWLADARKLGMTDAEAVLWARTRSFLDPDTQQWNAPGLGNTVHSISRDQERRQNAIARALTTYQQQGNSTPQIAPAEAEQTTAAAQPDATPPSQASSSTDEPDSLLAQLFNLDLPNLF